MASALSPRPRRRRSRLLLLFALAALPSACRRQVAAPGDTAAQAQVPPQLLGGRVEMGMQDARLLARAEFWSGQEGTRLDLRALPEGSCTPLPSPPPTVSGLLALGAEVRFERLDRRLRLFQTATASGVAYQPLESERPMAPGISYDVVLDRAQWLQSLRVPQEVGLLAPRESPLPLISGQDLSLQYAPVAADLLTVHLGSTGSGVVCRLGSSGSAVIPAAVIDAVPAIGTLTLQAVDQTEEMLGGRPILLEGITRRTAPYYRHAAGERPEETPTATRAPAKAKPKPTPRRRPRH